jgi:outer membrane usher protein
MDVPQTRFEVTPYRRGGAYVEIPVRLAASVQLRQQDGTPVPAGARVREQRGSAPVGNDGMAYVEGVAGDNSLQVEWEGGRCSVHLRLPVARASPSDDVEHLTCAAAR